MSVTHNEVSTQTTPPDISVVVPVYRSERSVGQLVSRIVNVLEASPWSFEIVLVDDESPDGVWQTLLALHQQYPRHVVAIQLMRNFGQHNATMCGFNHARGATVVTMDDDLQHAPEDIPKLVHALEEQQLDVVYGAYLRKKHSTFRNLGSWAINWVFKRVFRLTFNFSSFRAIRSQVVNSVVTYSLNFTFIDGLIAWSTRRVGAVAVDHHARSVGRSGYRLSALLLLALNLLTNFSIAPLQIASVTGILAAFVGFVLGTFYVLAYLLGDIAVPGFASIIIAVFVMGGLQLLALGTIGEYIGRLHLNFNRKPQFVVRQKLAASTQSVGAAGDASTGLVTPNQSLPFREDTR